MCKWIRGYNFELKFLPNEKDDERGKKQKTENINYYYYPETLV